MVEASLDALLNCLICFSRVQDPRLCPYCAGLCCADCIQRWLRESRASCPHCRSPLTERSLVNARLVVKLAELVECKEALCARHSRELAYFCEDCEEEVCADCALFEEAHKGHKFMRVVEVYGRKEAELRAVGELLSTRLANLKASETAIQGKIDALKRTKDALRTQMDQKGEALLIQLEKDLAERLQQGSEQRSALISLAQAWESCQREVTELTTGSKARLIGAAPAVISCLKEHLKVAIPSAIAVCAGFALSVKPEYVASAFILHDFAALQSHTEVTYSEPLHCYSSTWRLKLYPSGNGSAQHTHLSLFLEMLQGGVQGNYDYRVELVNPVDPDLRLVREFSTEFAPGECWGYNRFLQLEKLTTDGYLDPCEDRLVFRFAVRPSSYRQLCTSQRAYITALERTVACNRQGCDPAIGPKAASQSPLRESIEMGVVSEEENDGLSGNGGEREAWIERRFKGLMESLVA